MVSFSILSIERKVLFKDRGDFSKNETVVIIGDSSRILKYFPEINAEIVNIK